MNRLADTVIVFLIGLFCFMVGATIGHNGGLKQGRIEVSTGEYVCSQHPYDGEWACVKFADVGKHLECGQ